MVDEYILEHVLDKSKEIKGIGKLDDTKILVDIDDTLGNEITLKNVVIIVSCIMKNYDNFYP